MGGGGGVPGGVDFTGCVTDPDTGFCCVDKLEQVKIYLAEQGPTSPYILFADNNN